LYAATAAHSGEIGLQTAIYKRSNGLPECRPERFFVLTFSIFYHHNLTLISSAKVEVAQKPHNTIFMVFFHYDG
jgi:hypothetical protein